MKLKYLLFLSALTIGSVSHAGAEQTSHFALQGTIATDGAIGAGIARYTEHSEIGLTLSGITNNAEDHTKLFIPVLFGGWRKPIGDQTYFALGINLVNEIGTESGEHIHNDFIVGPYVSIEQALTKHVLLISWVDPYSYEYAKKGDDSISTSRFLASGGIGISYLF